MSKTKRYSDCFVSDSEATKVQNSLNISVDDPDVDDDTVSATVEPVIGTVVGCLKLNVREFPDCSSAVVYVAEHGAKLMIDTDRSTCDWLKVCTETGAEGYCMASYVLM
jgi:hypothetical protein